MTGIINIGNSFYSSLHTTRNTLTSSSEPPKKNAGMVVPSQNLTNFLNKLPYDIIHNIFSRLTQQDCLECMAVSMVWMELVPQYTTMLWKKIKISFDDNDYSDHEEELVTQLSPKMIRCLGSHVRHIVISHCSEEQVHLILSILSKRGCSPRTVEFHKCIIMDQSRFISALRHISSQLKELTFDHHSQNIALLRVLETCPKLTHFSFSVNSYAPPDVYDTEPLSTTTMLYEGDDDGMSRHPSNNNVVQEFNLTYLCLNAVLHKDKRTAPILRRCPKLQCLMIANIEADSDFYKWPSEKSVDLNMFFQLCPLLQYIECNSWGTSRKQQEQWRERARQQKNQQQQQEKKYSKGLRELITREAAGYGSNEIIPTIQQHTSTLEILSLGEGVSTMTRQTANPSDWTQLEQITQSLPQLHTFSCKYLKFSGRVLVGFLEKCPRLTELTLWCMLELPDDMLLVLNQLPHLTKLDLGVATTSSRATLPSETSWCWFFNQNNTLRHLCLRWGHFVTDSVVDAIASIEHLEELQLVHTAKWATTMDTLRGLTHLKRLELWTVNAPLDSVLKDLYWLQDIQLIGCSEVSCHSLRELVDHPNGMLSKLRIQRCGSIQLRTLEYIENKLASRQQEQQQA